MGWSLPSRTDRLVRTTTMTLWQGGRSLNKLHPVSGLLMEINFLRSSTSALPLHPINLALISL